MLDLDRGGRPVGDRSGECPRSSKTTMRVVWLTGFGLGLIAAARRRVSGPRTGWAVRVNVKIQLVSRVVLAIGPQSHTA
jgi:hypothetical protein